MTSKKDKKRDQNRDKFETGWPIILPSSYKKRLRVSSLRSVQATMAEGGNLLSRG